MLDRYAPRVTDAAHSILESWFHYFVSICDGDGLLQAASTDEMMASAGNMMMTVVQSECHHQFKCPNLKVGSRGLVVQVLDSQGL